MEATSLILNNELYTHVPRHRPSRSVHVYRGDQKFLRIGDPGVVDADKEIHKKLRALGYPVAEILEEGEYDGQHYYTEESLGDEVLGMACRDTCLRDSVMSDEVFGQLCTLVETYVDAQARAATFAPCSLWEGMHIPLLLAEFPEWEADITALYTLLVEKLAGLPFTYVHGDFNAFNMFPRGVIDLEDVFVAPLGYDAVCATYHPYLFPEEAMEVQRVMWFSDEQRARYLALVNEVHQRYNQPPVTEYLDELIMMRAVWGMAGVGDAPLLQAWRKQKLTRMIDAYGRGESVEEIVREG